MLNISDLIVSLQFNPTDKLLEFISERFARVGRVRKMRKNLSG